MPKLNIKIKKLHSKAKIPTIAHPGEDAALDFYSIETIEIPSLFNNTKVSWRPVTEVHTGVAIEIPKGYFGLLAARSSFGAAGLRIHPGVIDSGYRGEITILFTNFYDESFQIHEGDKIAQLLILPVPDIHVVESNKLSVSKRGKKGFGSSGR